MDSVAYLGVTEIQVLRVNKVNQEQMDSQVILEQMVHQEQMVLMVLMVVLAPLA